MDTTLPDFSQILLEAKAHRLVRLVIEPDAFCHLEELRPQSYGDSRTILLTPMTQQALYEALRAHLGRPMMMAHATEVPMALDEMAGILRASGWQVYSPCVQQALAAFPVTPEAVAVEEARQAMEAVLQDATTTPRLLRWAQTILAVGLREWKHAHPGEALSDHPEIEVQLRANLDTLGYSPAWAYGAHAEALGERLPQWFPTQKEAP